MKTFQFNILILFILFILPHIAYAQKDYDSLSFERIYLHTDRAIYIAGEKLFYTMYYQGNPGKMSRYAYLIIRDQNNSIATNVRLEINNQISYGNIILSDTLKSGLYQILCYTNLMRNAEDTYFKKDLVIANRFDEKLSFLSDQFRKVKPTASRKKPSENRAIHGNLDIHLDKEEFNPREKIVFTVEQTNMLDDSITNLSISVSEILPVFPDEPSISDYFTDNKELSRIHNSSVKSCKFMPEFSRAVLQGRVIAVTSSGTKPDPSNKYILLLSTPDSLANLQFTSTDSLGSFTLFLDPYYDGKELIIRTKEQEKASIEIDDKCSLTQSFNSLIPYDIPGMKEYLIRSSKIAQARRYYDYKENIDTQKVFLSSPIIPAVYQKVYSRIHPVEYIDLPDFVEVSREIVPALKISKKHENFVSSYPSLQYKTNSDIEPTIFLDGVPIDNVNQIIHLGSKDIKYIETIPLIRYYGEMSFHGILSVISNNQAIKNIQFKSPVIRYHAILSQSYTQPEAFKPENIVNHHPDLRQVLLWEPACVPAKNKSKKIECYASDLKGEYKITIQGISSGGNPVCGSAIITIR
jgi:hypothetical protein